MMLAMTMTEMGPENDCVTCVYFSVSFSCLVAYAAAAAYIAGMAVQVGMTGSTLKSSSKSSSSSQAAAAAPGLANTAAAVGTSSSLWSRSSTEWLEIVVTGDSDNKMKNRDSDLTLPV